MSETNLNVRLTATDGASPSVRQLQSSVKTLEQQLAQLGAISANASARAAAGIDREIAATREKIAVLQQEIALKNQNSAVGIRAAMQEAEYINRNMDLVQRKMNAETRLRNEAVRAEIAASDAAARYEAESINLGMARREAAARAEAEYINRNVMLRAAAQRAEAEYINRNSDLVSRKVTREQEEKAAAQRAEAEYINRDMDLRNAAMRAEADYMNREFDLRAKRRRVPVSGADGGMDAGFMQRMSRHVVGLFDSLARGQRGQAISSLGAAARDAGLGVAGLAASMGALIAVAGTATLLHAAENLGKWATETKAAAAATGMSLRNYSSLQGALSLIGVKAESADTTLRRLSVNLAEALADPASKAAEAFHNLGISQEALVKTGGDTDAALKLLADAFQRTADGANKSENMNEIFGRGFEKIIPLLQQGSTGVEELTRKAQALGITLDESGAAKLEAAGRAVEQLGQHIRGDAITAFEAWSPVIIGVAHALENMLAILTRITSAIGVIVAAPAAADKWLSEHIPGYGAAARAGVKDSTMRGYLNAIATPPEGNESPDVADARRNKFAGAAPKRDVPPLTTPGSALDAMRVQMTAAALAASKGGDRQAEGRAEIAVMRETLATAVLSTKQKEQLQTEINQKQIQLNNEAASAGTKAAKQSYADFAAAERLKLAEAEGSSVQIKAIYDEWINVAIGKYRQLGSEVDKLRAKELEAVNASKRKEIMDSVRGDEAQTRLSVLDQQLGRLTSGTAPVRGQHTGPVVDMQNAQGFIAEAQQIDAAYKAQISALKQYGATAEQVVGIEIQAKQKEVELYGKAAEATQAAANKILAPFLNMFDRLGSEFENFTNSALKSLIAPQVTLEKRGLTTVKTVDRGGEIANAVRNLLMSGITSASTAVQSALGQMLARALSGGASNTMGELLGNLLSKAVVSIFPSLAGSLGGAAVGATALTAAGTTLAGAGVGLGAAATALGVAATSLQVAAVASAIPIPGFASGGIVPSAAGGMITGGAGATLAILHSREMVLPAQISQGLQSLIANNTNNSPTNNANLHYSPTINTGARGRSGSGMTRGEFAQLMGLHSGSLLGEARNMMRQGWRPA